MMTTPNPYFAASESEIAALPSPPASVEENARRIYSLRRVYMLLDGCRAPEPTVEPDDFDEDGCGGFFAAWPPIPPRPAPYRVDGCSDLSQLADYLGGGQ